MYHGSQSPELLTTSDNNVPVLAGYYNNQDANQCSDITNHIDNWMVSQTLAQHCYEP